MSHDIEQLRRELERVANQDKGWSQSVDDLSAAIDELATLRDSLQSERKRAEDYEAYLKSVEGALDRRVKEAEADGLSWLHEAEMANMQSRQANARADAATAESAALREALEKVATDPEGSGDWRTHFAKAALSTSAGRELLERLRKLRDQVASLGATPCG
jgi:chromosome segregation ATPase